MSCLVFLLVFVCFLAVNDGKNPPTCPSKIYCHGRLLHTVQMASVFPDSKTFVDMKLKYTEDETLGKFEEMMVATGERPTDMDILKFVLENFDPEGSEFQPWDPSDWVGSPKFLDSIRDAELKSWASDLNGLWKFLGRKMSDSVRDNPEQYSAYYVPNPVIVPGGRFREFYYWDSYWIIKGLILSEMFTTVKGMLSNFMLVVDNVGFVPNGGRIYYSMRSQPPLLIPMVKAYLDATKDYEFLGKHIDTLEKEIQFWMSNRTVTVKKNGKSYTLARYADASSGPRPESYREDVMSAQFLTTDDEKNEYFSQLKSAAESGWDFSSRWFIKDGTNNGNLNDVKTKSIVPVDLNAIIYWDAKLLSEFFDILKMPEKATVYIKIAEKWKEGITNVMWHDDIGAWLDYDLLNRKRREYFYPSNLVPLWTMCYDNATETVSKVLKYLESQMIQEYPGGVPSSEEHTGEQWDYPNAWPPLQHMIILGLDSTGDPWARRYAFELASKWVQSNYRAYNTTRAMYEKYDATVFGGHGGGGEYKVQLGFGWSNGVIIDLLTRYGQVISAFKDLSEIEVEQTGLQNVSSSPNPASVSILLFLLSTSAAASLGYLNLF